MHCKQQLVAPLSIMQGWQHMHHRNVQDNKENGMPCEGRQSKGKAPATVHLLPRCETVCLLTSN